MSGCATVRRDEPGQEGWHDTTINGAAETVSTGPFGSLLHKRDYVGGGVPVINPVNLVDGRICPSADVTVTTETAGRLSAYRVRAGDVLVGRRGDIGRCALASESNEGWLCGTGCFFIRPSSKTEPRFLSLLLGSPEYRKRLEGAATGTTMLNLSNGALSDLAIRIPSREEQKRIVAVLDQTFAALDRAHAEANLADADELLENLLDTLFQKLATANPAIALKDAVHPDCKLSYGIVQPGGDVQGGLPIVRPVDLKQRVITLKGLKTIAPHSAYGYTRTTLVGGELLLCVRGSTGELSIASRELAAGNVTRGIVPIRFESEKVLSDFAYFQMRSRYVRAQIATKTYGAALMQINIKDVREIRFAVPPVAEQARIVARAESLYVRSETSHFVMESAANPCCKKPSPVN